MNDKHKRTFNSPFSASEIDKAADIVKDILRSLQPKQQRIFSEWLDTWKLYIAFETNFEPRKMRYYKRGEIVLVHFGYNVGSELGGIHYAIVVENNNNIASPTLTVVPLSSLETGKTSSSLHPSTVFLGNVVGNKDSYAMPLQIRSISKLRIVKPKHKADTVYKISKDHLNQIDDKIKLLFTRTT